MSRQINIALELKKRECKIIFIVKEFPQALSLVENYDFKIIKLSTKDLNLNDSIKEMKSVIFRINEHIDYFIVDLLDFFNNQEYLNTLKEFCTDLIIITDHTSPFYVEAEKVFALSENQKLENYKYIKNTKYYTGLKYFPLGKQFQNQEKRRIKKTVEKILITFGGTDFVNYSTRVAKFLRNFYFNGEITFIIGPNFLKDNYKEFQKEISDNIIVKRNVKNMIDYFQNSDLCICSAGNTLIELLTCGVPCIVLPQTNREEEHAIAFEEKELIINLGLKWNENTLDSALNEILNNYRKRKTMSELSQEIFDGQGLKRMIDIILD